MTYQLHHGNMLDILPMMDRESIDAIVTDPPYGLGFMGKDWDHGVPGEHFWREAYRVAKPGAHLLAFGGTRTFHRLACAIEDAGWEIRDTVMWVYGQGFPKSHDVSKAIDREAGAEREVIGRARGTGKQNPQWNGTAQGRSENSLKPEYDATIPATEQAQEWDGWGTALKPAFESVIVAQKPIDTDAERSIIVENLYTLEAQLWLLSLANIAEENLKSSQVVLNAALNTARWTADNWRSTQAALCDQMDISQFASMVHTILNTVLSWLNIWEEALKHGSIFITETVSSQIIDLRTLNSSVSALTLKSIIEAETIQPGSWLNVLPAARILNAVATKLSATLDLSAIENAINAGLMPSPDAIDPNVSSLPIIVARKPITGTVAENVQRYGTGALNVDACRIEMQSDDREAYEEKRRSFAGTTGNPQNGAFLASPMYSPEQLIANSAKGRWPANLIHDGSAEVLAGFPQTGVSRGGNSTNIGGYGAQNVDENMRGVSCGFGDTGSAARFFYCAKASKQDRDEGLEGLELRVAGIGDQRPSGSMSQRIHPNEGRPDTLNRNHHPTVKPTALMRYLCRLVTPPNGVILDPFMGSGSTGKAAMLEGFNFVGVDTEIEYVEIAARRIEHACEKVGIVVDQPMMFETKREVINRPKQLILL